MDNNENFSYCTEEWMKIREKIFLKLSSNGRIIFPKQFQSLIKEKNSFLAKRVYDVCNNHESDVLSIDKYIAFVRKLIRSNDSDKFKFMFDIFDINGNGKLELPELKIIIKSTIDEKELYFTDEEIDNLSVILLENFDTNADNCIDFNEFYALLISRRDITATLITNVYNWFLPKPEPKKRFQFKPNVPQFVRWPRIRNNYPNVIFFSLILSVNIVLFVTRAIEFYFPENPNHYYMISRATARCLYFDSTILIMLMFRRCITFLRAAGLSSILPLDHHIYYHKIVALFVVILGSVHSICHILDFIIIFPVRDNFGNFTATDFLFHPKATMKFGLIKGYACITGYILFAILVIIAVFAQPCFRRIGKFNLFLFTHSLFVVWYIALILHAPHFWKWFLFPGIIYAVESLRRLIWVSSPLGQSCVYEAKLLPSRVIHLAIERQHAFHYNCGDYVFLNIPDISRTEWHPFTISSAPEQRDVFWLHIRAVGVWTNRLHDYFLNRVPVDQSPNRSTNKFLENSPVFVFPELDVENAKRNSIDRKTQNFAKEVVYAMESVIKVRVDGPYGTPSTRIFNAQHAVLIATGIGVTPFASILQSIAYKLSNKSFHSLSNNNLKKVDFIWINREQKNFEWFVKLLLDLEQQMETRLQELRTQLKMQFTANITEHLTESFETELESRLQKQMESERMLSFHMYMTAVSERIEMRSLMLQLALQWIREKTDRSFITGLRDRTHYGRPNWDQLFAKIRQTKRGEVTVFFCGSPLLSKMVRKKCSEFQFNFRKETF